MKSLNRFIVIFGFLTLVGVPFKGVFAQSLLVGIPSADITPKDHLCITHESQFGPGSGNNRVKWNSFTFLTYGVTPKLEIAFSVYNFGAPRSNNRSLGMGYKYSEPLYMQNGWEVKLTGGQMLTQSLENNTAEGKRRPNEIGGWVYGFASVRVPNLKTRFSFGPSYGTGQIFGIGKQPLSVMAGVEQPLSKRFTLVADWFSGQHDLGNLIAGLQYMDSHRNLLILGYKHSNNSAEPGALIVEFALELDFRRKKDKPAY